MSEIGYASLGVIPSFSGFKGQLERGTASSMAAAGKTGGAKFGNAAGMQAGTQFKSGLASKMKGFAAPFAGVLATVGIGKFFKDSFAEAKEAGQISRTTAKLIETTGEAANLTAVQVGTLSEKMMAYAAVDDELIQSGANVMLTFKNVRNELGEGGAIFDRSIKAGLDLATVLKSDLSSSALQLGKALNDPIKGITSLGRAGVQFTEQQKEQIKALVASGDLLSAQKVILAEVEGQVGGAAGASADATDRLAVSFGNLKEAAGERLMPAVTAFSDWAVQDGVPAMSAVGGAAADTASAIAGLPAPVKGAAAAFVALRIAAATGLTASVASSATSVGSAMTDLRLRTMLAGDAFKVARAGVMEFNGNSGTFVKSAGRMTSSMSALKAGAAGAGAGLKRGLGSAMSLVGGPWGAAVAVGTAVLFKFWQESKEAKQRVSDFTDALDEQTGALTVNNRELAFKTLQESGAIDIAKKYGISLEVVTNAALGNAAAAERVNAAMTTLTAAQIEAAGGQARVSLSSAQLTIDQQHLREAIGDGTATVNGSKAAFKDHAEAMGESTEATGENADATGDAGGAYVTYAERIRGARDAIKDLMDAENKRRENNVTNKRDQLALLTTIADVRKEARNGRRTLDENTKAGQENMGSLLDLADQWDNSSSKVRNARGAYKDLRQTFIDLAIDMGASDRKAERLADRFVTMPKKHKIDVTLPGMEKALADVAKLKDRLTSMGDLAAYVSNHQANDPRLKGFAHGGKVGGTGYGDKQLILADSREWVMNPRSSAYYGDDFMRRLNNMQIPKFAGGGPVSQVRASSGGGGGGDVHHHYHGIKDVNEARRAVSHEKRAEALGGFDFRGR